MLHIQEQLCSVTSQNVRTGQYYQRKKVSGLYYKVSMQNNAEIRVILFIHETTTV